MAICRLPDIPRAIDQIPQSAKFFGIWIWSSYLSWHEHRGKVPSLTHCTHSMGFYLEETSGGWSAFVWLHVWLQCSAEAFCLWHGGKKSTEERPHTKTVEGEVVNRSSFIIVTGQHIGQLRNAVHKAQNSCCSHFHTFSLCSLMMFVKISTTNQLLYILSSLPSRSFHLQTQSITGNVARCSCTNLLFQLLIGDLSCTLSVVMAIS